MALWTPSQIDTALWLDAADASTITVATGVSQWDDKSGNARHVSQSTAGNQPAYNSSPAYVQFDGTDDYLQVSSRLGFPVNPDITALMVVNVLSTTTPGLTLLHIGGQESGVMQMCADTDGWGWRFNNGNRMFSPVTTSTNFLVAYRRQESTNYGASEVYLDGSELTESASVNTTDVLTSTTDLTIVGNAHSDSADYQKPSHSRISEIVVVPSAFMGTRQTIEGYLAHKWGLEANLPADHPYKLYPPGFVPFRRLHNPRTNKVIPALSVPTVTDIGANCVRPRVTKGY